MSQLISSSPPQGQDPPARGLSADFVARYASFERKMSQVALDILVWGPSPTGITPVAQKRQEIHRQLRALNFNAMFSEGLEEVRKQAGQALMPSEFNQARACHLIIALIEASPGASAEVYGFCTNPAIAPNLYVMVPVKYKQGYAGQGPLQILDEGWHNVYWYEDGEIESCNVLTKAVECARARCSAYAMHQVIL